MKLADLNLNLAYTYADYLKWQIEQQIELIKGKIFKMSVSTCVHQELSSVISNQLYNFLKNKKCKVIGRAFIASKRYVRQAELILTALYIMQRAIIYQVIFYHSLSRGIFHNQF